MAENQTVSSKPRPRVVIIGAGFGGLSAARALANKPVDVVVIDRNNYHGFWPLLYQVSTAQLQPQEITQPVRAIAQNWGNVEFFLATVQSIDRERRVVVTDRHELRYDELIVSPGSATNFFGLDQVAEHGFELKDIPDALVLRNHLLTRFEQACTETDLEEIRKHLTFVVVGGGPTGVELAGAMAELIRHVLRKDYPTLDFSQVRVILLEMMDRVLPPFPAPLSQKAERALTKMGVEVRLGAQVTAYEDGYLHLKDGEKLPAETVIWTAGVKASPLGETLNAELQKGGRVKVMPELHLPDEPHVWVIGDLAYLEGPDGKPYPQLAAVAMQQGKTVAHNILRKLEGKPLQPFQYFNKGIMATIGRGAAVANIWRLNIGGRLAWFLWLVVHLWQLVGFRNRVLVFINWAYNYLTYERANRSIVTQTRRKEHKQDEYEQHAAALVGADGADTREQQEIG